MCEHILERNLMLVLIALTEPLKELTSGFMCGGHEHGNMPSITNITSSAVLDAAALLQSQPTLPTAAAPPSARVGQTLVQMAKSHLGRRLSSPPTMTEVSSAMSHGSYSLPSV
ncbi:hypothetical protein SK128_018160, partial [Halocaridina rubra]